MAVVQGTLVTDPDWVRRDPATAEVRLDVAGVDPSQFWEMLNRQSIASSRSVEC